MILETQIQGGEYPVCLICDRIKMIRQNSNLWFVKELETGYVVIGDHQYFRGYPLFLCKEHKTELFQLDDDTKMKFLEEMSVVAQAVAKAFGAEKMNYELLATVIPICTGICFPGYAAIWRTTATTAKALSGGTRWKKCTVPTIVHQKSNWNI